jgi:hypothetical protein
VLGHWILSSVSGSRRTEKLGNGVTLILVFCLRARKGTQRIGEEGVTPSLGEAWLFQSAGGHTHMLSPLSGCVMWAGYAASPHLFL